jgi:hypothetical protein
MSISKELAKVPLEAQPGSSQIPVPINLGDVIRQALQPFLSAGRNREVIFRCDDLPAVSAEPGVIQEVFSRLIRMIMQHPSDSRKFFYIRCEEKLPSLKQKAARSTYIIEFHTNLSNHSQWMQLNQESILDCQQIMLRHGLDLAVHEITTTGCLFSISLQGKLL